MRRPLTGLWRANDHSTSIEAGLAVSEKRSALQATILEALQRLGPMTDRELEALPVFARYAPSTVRKRRSELYQDECIEPTGERRGRLKVWRLVPTQARLFPGGGA